MVMLHCGKLFRVQSHRVNFFRISYSCLIYVRALVEYVIFIIWLRSVIRMLRSVKFAEGKVLTFLILREKC